MQKCKHRHSDLGKNEENNSSSANDDTSEEDSSDGSIFEKDFFANSKKDSDNSTKNTGNRWSSRRFRSEHNKREFASRPYYLNPSNYTRMRQDSQKSNNNGDNRESRDDRMNFNNRRAADDNNQRDQSCSVQCFFDELNLVDQRGFPERTAVTKMTLSGIQDPTLRDFVEESILECFHFLAGDMNQDKCMFSENLLSCFTDKGKERCEDWND